LIVTSQNQSAGHGRPSALTPDALADLAHELRSPLGGIEAMVELLAESVGRDRQDEVIDGLKAAAAHLRAVAAGLLGPAGSAGQHDVEALIRSFSVATRARASLRALGFVERIDSSCTAIRMSDPVAVRQILENLVDNAIRLTPSGTIILDAAPCRSGDQQGLRLSVRDEGPGLGDHDAQKVFERGAMLPGRAGGTGLGLAIVAELVRKLGGSCGAGNRPDGRGAEFWVELPVAPASEATGPVTGQTGNSPYVNPGCPILIIDDDVSSRTLLTTVLDHLGFEAEACPSPMTALTILRSRPVLAVMTDVVMPEMDGCTLVSTIRALDGSSARLPIIAVTGKTDRETAQRLAEAGCDGVIGKPITVHDLRQMLLRTGLLSTRSRAA